MSWTIRGRFRTSTAALALALAVAACQVGPPPGVTGGEGQLSAGRTGRAKVTVGGKEITFQTADGKPLTGLAVQIGGKSYPIKDGKLALPADALARAKAEGGLVVLAPGYVPRRIALDGAAEVALAPLATDQAAQVISGAGGEALGAGDAFGVRFDFGRLERPASVVVSPYEPIVGGAQVASAELERLRRALAQAGARMPGGCDDPLPCPPPAGALGVLVAIDGPLKPGPLPVTIDLNALGPGWTDESQLSLADLQLPAAWSSAQKAHALAAARLILTLAAIDRRPDAQAWHAALATEFDLSWIGRRLTVDVPVGEQARTSGTTRIDVVGAGLLGTPLEVTVVSAVEGTLPAEARPPGMPPPAQGPAVAGATVPPGDGTTRALHGGTHMGPDGGGLITTAGPFTGGPADTLIGMDGASLIGMDGATLIGMDGASLIGMDGATLIGMDGASLIGMDGASLIGMDGASLVGPDGATLIGPDGASLVGPDGASLVANNAGGAITGHVRVPFSPDAAKYRLASYTDHEWPSARVWAMDGYGRPYAQDVTTDERGAYRIDQLGSTMSGVFIAVLAGPSKLFALAKAPGSGSRDVLVDAATTGAASVYLTDVLRSPRAMRPVNQDRYLALAAALRARMGQAEAESFVSKPIAEVARNVRTFCAASGIPVDLTGTVSTIAGVPMGYGGVFTPGPAASVRFNGPSDVVYDPATNRLLVADMFGGGIRAIDLGTLQASTVGGPINRPRGFARLPDGRLLVASVGGNGIFTVTGGTATRFAGSTRGFLNGPALSAQFVWPTGIAADSAGNVFVPDPQNSSIRKVAAGTGIVSTFAGGPGTAGHADGPASGARFAGPDAIAIDQAGNHFIADRDNHCIRRIDPAGVVSTLAGLPGVAGSDDGFGGRARFFFPKGLALDATGALWVSDSGNGLIRRIGRSGLVTTITGGRPRLPTEIIAHSDGPASSALFSDNHGLCFGPGGDLFVADQSNHCVRRIQF